MLASTSGGGGAVPIENGGRHEAVGAAASTAVSYKEGRGGQARTTKGVARLLIGRGVGGLFATFRGRL